MAEKEFEITILVPHKRVVTAVDIKHAANVAKATCAQVTGAVLTRVVEIPTNGFQQPTV